MTDHNLMHPPAPSLRRTPEQMATGLSCWSEPVEAEALGGGLTNTNFAVTHRGERYVVRIGDDIPLHGITRRHEVEVCRSAFSCGLSPEIIHHEPGALVMRYVEATTLTEQDIREPDMLDRVVSLIRRAHREMPDHLSGTNVMFWVFQVNRQYLAVLSEVAGRGISVRDPGEQGFPLDRLASLNASLEELIAPIQPTFCHNDLLPANFLDDGERLWLIDWEYAGWNSPWFDLANLASNAQLDDTQQGGLIEAYFERAATANDLERLRAMECASLLRESLWSMVQEIHSTISSDFEAYTDAQLSRLESANQRLGAHR